MRLFSLGASIFEGGWLGVDIFFNIWILISNIIISEHLEGKFLFKKFYLRRARRLLPSLFFTMLMTIPFSIAILSPKAFKEYTEALLSSLFFYANFYFKSLDFYIAEPSKFNPLLHMWSLAIEEQFYILFPVVLFLFFKIIRRHLFSILLALFSISVYLNSTEQGYDKFYNLEFRAWELLLGALIMIISSNIRFEKIEILGLFLIVFSIYYFDNNWIIQIE